MALLMTCPNRSVHGWDIIVTKHGETLVFDKRINSKLDFVTVTKTAIQRTICVQLTLMSTSPTRQHT
eukprot:TRINITY_DN1943_c0_g1_i1.p3 TRINITY_DN1943_c0_g1~~TRINITY_DN1943_c0_g1_i1.p3  ORF type:complete len:67 (-),score=14.48 TRINITY_DN1943_c0_g1_i1:749-949(-)